MLFSVEVPKQSESWHGMAYWFEWRWTSTLLHSRCNHVVRIFSLIMLYCFKRSCIQKPSSHAVSHFQSEHQSRFHQDVSEIHPHKHPNSDKEDRSCVPLVIPILNIPSDRNVPHASFFLTFVPALCQSLRRLDSTAYAEIPLVSNLSTTAERAVLRLY